MKIGIFDSGRGGQFVAEALRSQLPEHEFIVIDDRKNLPYGNRTKKEITQLTEKAISPLLEACPIIVIACNTATAAAIDYLRDTYPNTKFVGFEPMIKPAVTMSEERHFTVLATKFTVTSERYCKLVDEFASDAIIDIPDTTNWVTFIEADTLGKIDITETEASIDSGSDVIVIACTHYLALVPLLRSMFPVVHILEPTAAVARRIIDLTTP